MSVVKEMMSKAFEICSRRMPIEPENLEDALRLGSLTNRGHDLLEMMLGAGADPDTMLPCGERPLHLAILLNDPSAVKLLVRYHANPLAKNRAARIPFVLLCALSTSLEDWPDDEQDRFATIFALIQTDQRRNTETDIVPRI